VSDALDEGLVQRVDARGTTPWSGESFRYTGAHRDPLSGEGARRFGGRWNPPLLFPAIYLADSARACMVEVERAADAASTTADKMLQAAYRLHTVDVAELAVLDLRTAEAQEAVGLEVDDIFGDDWAPCQAVGHAAWFLHMQGVLAPAAGGVGLVITGYEQRTRPGQLAVRESVDLTPEKYRLLRVASDPSD
jgi:RES domain-containing protein